MPRSTSMGPSYVNGQVLSSGKQKNRGVMGLQTNGVSGKSAGGTRPWVAQVTPFVSTVTVSNPYVAIDSRGNVISTFSYTPAVGSSSSCVVSYDPSGKVNWTLPVRSPGSDYAIQSVTVDGNDNIIYAAFVSASIPSSIVKITPNGGILWSKYFGSYASYTITNPKVTTDSLGNIYLTGYAGLSGQTIIIKMDSSGNTVWQYAIPRNTYTQGSGDIAVDSAGNLIFTTSAFQDLGCCGSAQYTWFIKMSALTGTITTPALYGMTTRYASAVNKVPMAIHPITGKYYFGSYNGSEPEFSIINTNYTHDTSYSATALSSQEVRAITFNKAGFLFIVVMNRSSASSYSVWMFDTTTSVISHPTLIKTTTMSSASALSVYDMKATDDAVYVTYSRAGVSYVEKILFDRGSYTTNRLPAYTNTPTRTTGLFSALGSGVSTSSISAAVSAYPDVDSALVIDRSHAPVTLDTLYAGS